VSTLVAGEFTDIAGEPLQVFNARAMPLRINGSETPQGVFDDLLSHTEIDATLGFGLWAQGQATEPEYDGLLMQQALREEWPE
jgi:hypothetical protein